MEPPPKKNADDTLNRKPSSKDGAQTILLINNTVAKTEAETELPQEEKIEAMNPQSSNDAAQNILVLNNTAAEAEAETELPQENRVELLNPKPSNDVVLDQEQKEEEPLCRVLKANADFCEIEGDVRVDSNSSTIFLIRPRSSAASWTIQPYPRKGIAFVKQWTVRVAAAADGGSNTIPKCTQNHPHPALLFSIGGFTGNHFHDFADLLFPLFTTSFHFQRNVHFLAADNKPWWLSKYRPLLHQLTRHDILDTDHETHDVHCYSKLTAGLRFHRELVADPVSGVSMSQFRQLLRQTYSLERKKAVVRTRGGASAKPRLMIVSRQRTRILINEDQVSRMARKLGYEVVSAESDVSTNLTKFAQLVNSCDVMMGVHGAGLTNMVFLPEKAVLIQVVPLGAIDIFAKLDFGDPSAGMNIRYLGYKIELKESSLLQRYPMDHPVIKDPLSIHKQGWDKLRQVYLHNQNVTIDVARFRPTLAKALRLLRS